MLFHTRKVKASQKLIRLAITYVLKKLGLTVGAVIYIVALCRS